MPLKKWPLMWPGLITEFSAESQSRQPRLPTAMERSPSEILIFSYNPPRSGLTSNRFLRNETASNRFYEKEPSSSRGCHSRGMGAAQGLDLPLPLLLEASEGRRQSSSAGRRGGRGGGSGAATATRFGVVEEPAHSLLSPLPTEKKNKTRRSAESGLSSAPPTAPPPPPPPRLPPWVSPAPAELEAPRQRTQATGPGRRTRLRSFRWTRHRRPLPSIGEKGCEGPARSPIGQALPGLRGRERSVKREASERIEG